MNKKVIIIGASGHGKVIADIIRKSNDTVVGFLDSNLLHNSMVQPYLARSIGMLSLRIVNL